jgi:hypothetical protein
MNGNRKPERCGVCGRTLRWCSIFGCGYRTGKTGEAGR